MPQHQPDLFSDQPADWELDDASTRRVATVVFTEGPTDEAYSYLVPDELRSDVEPGRRVKVPLGRGNRTVTGYCIEVADQQTLDRRLKNVASVVDRRRLLSPAMLRLTQWIADHYLCPLGQVLEAVVPAGVRSLAGTRMVTLLSVPVEVKSRLAQLELPRKQAEVLSYLAASPVPLERKQLAHAARCTTAPIKSLEEKGYIRAQRRRVSRPPAAGDKIAREVDFELGPEQQRALATILAALRSGKQETQLLFGVTGSGKTEVYIQAIQEVVRYGRQAIVLVPEISLTPQTVGRFRARFDSVAVLHSHLSDVERHHQWQQIASGEVQVVVGARSAIFAPTPHLGLIVLDEEHEWSFKQDTVPRYHARDVALQRAAAEGVPLVLGSATPSLESWQQAQAGKFKLLRLPKRVYGRPLPAVGTIDLREEVRSKGKRGAVSRKLALAIGEALDDGGQVILLLNRRGFSTHIQCPACGEVVRCPSCELPLTYHRNDEIALCHYCDYEQPAPPRCPSCEFIGIRYSGFGTQKLEAEVKARFPDQVCVRMDSDAMRKPGSHERALDQFRRGEARILLGTQMIAKGLDFPGVTLVGVINADTALHLPDFRAVERTFQLLAQVAGRTGRGEQGGRVLVQTFNPEHPAIEAATRHDFESFAALELPTRQALQYPPYAQLARLVVRGPQEQIAMAFATEVGQRLQEALAGGPQHRVLGPVPCPIAKLRDQFRFQLLVQAAEGETLRDALRKITRELQAPDDVQWIIDIDPLSMM